MFRVVGVLVMCCQTVANYNVSAVGQIKSQKIREALVRFVQGKKTGPVDTETLASS